MALLPLFTLKVFFIHWLGPSVLEIAHEIVCVHNPDWILLVGHVHNPKHLSAHQLVVSINQDHNIFKPALLDSPLYVISCIFFILVPDEFGPILQAQAENKLFC